MAAKGITVRRAAAVYARSLGANYRSIAEYPTDFWVMAVTGGLWLMVQFAFIAILFTNVNEVGGWSYHEMLLLAGFLITTRALTPLCWNGIWELGGKVVDGGLDYLLTRPAPVALQLVSRSVGMQGFGSIALGLVMVTSGWIGADLGLAAIPLALFLFACAAVVQLGLVTLANAVNFWIKGSRPIVGTILGELQDQGQRYPLTVFPNAVRLTVTYAIPLAFTAFVPVQILTGQLSGWWLSAPPVAAAITISFAVLLFRAGVRTYESAGN